MLAINNDYWLVCLKKIIGKYVAGVSFKVAIINVHHLYRCDTNVNAVATSIYISYDHDIKHIV